MGRDRMEVQVELETEPGRHLAEEFAGLWMEPDLGSDLGQGRQVGALEGLELADT